MEFILASKSPRRIELLSRYIEEFSVIPSKVQEKTGKNNQPEIIAMSIAYEKGHSISKSKPDAVVISADTVVYCEEILGKPKDRDDAYRMLSHLNGKKHRVITGVSIICLEKKIKIVDFSSTEVYFRELSEKMIEDYLNTKEYLDKAGAYGIQGIGEILCKEIKGSYSNVVGLPIAKLDSLLIKHLGKGLFNINE